MTPLFWTAALMKYEEEARRFIWSFLTQPNDTFHFSPSNTPGAAITKSMVSVGASAPLPGLNHNVSFVPNEEEVANRLATRPFTGVPEPVTFILTSDCVIAL